MFSAAFFPVDAPSKIMEVRGVIFRRRRGGKWVAEGTDLRQIAEKLVREIVRRSKLRGVDEESKRHAVYRIMYDIAHKSPSDGRDILDGLVQHGFKIVPPSTGSWPIASA
jgi:hypothetical protein